MLGEYTQIVSDTLNANQWVEGPSIYKLNEDDNADAKYCLLVDNYGAGGYYPLVTNDLDSGVFTRPSSYKMPSRARHGTPIRVTAEEYRSDYDSLWRMGAYANTYPGTDKNAGKRYL